MDDLNCSYYFHANYQTYEPGTIVRTLYSFSKRWHGEGDEHIWIDSKIFRRLYNITFAPIHVYHLPFGGATRNEYFFTKYTAYAKPHTYKELMHYRTWNKINMVEAFFKRIY